MAPEERRFTDGYRVLLILVRCCHRRIGTRPAEGKGECDEADDMRRSVAWGIYYPTVRRVGWTLLPSTCSPHGILGLLDWFQVEGYALKAKAALESCADEAMPTELAWYA